MYAQLGNIRFTGPKGFTSFEEIFSVEYAQHSRVNRKPRLEHTGDVLDSISFEMYLHSTFTDPEADIQELKKMQSTREILPLILGNGTVVGNFVIPTLSKTTEFTDPSGNLIAVVLTVELLEFYSDDPLADAKRQSIKEGFATSTRSSNVRTVLPAKLSQGMGVTQQVAEIQTQGIIVSQYTAEAEKNTNTFQYYSDKINDSLDSMNQNIQSVQNQLSNSQELLDLATTLPVALNDIYTNIQNMKAVFPITDIEGFKVLNRQLQGSILRARTANVKISNQSVIRRK